MSVFLGTGELEAKRKAEAEAAAAAKLAEERKRDTVLELDGTKKIQGEEVSSIENETLPVEPEVVDVGSSRNKEDLGAQLETFSAKMPKDEHEKAAAKELYDEMSEEYRRYIKEKVAALPIVRYHRRAPFTEDEKKIIAAGLMSRQAHYKIAQVLRCSYAKIDKAILEDEFARDIPVIFLTSIADKKQIYAVLKSYPAGYILKPPDREKILSVIGDVLSKE